MDTISKLTQETTHGVQDTVSTIGKLADLSTRLTSAIGRFKLGKEYQLPAGRDQSSPRLKVSRRSRRTSRRATKRSSSDLLSRDLWPRLLTNQGSLSSFLIEAGEHIQNLNKGLLSLEKDPKNSGMIDELFRAAHTLKGSAAMMGFQGISDVAHKAEDMLGQFRAGSAPIRKDTLNFLFDSVDAIKLMVDGVSSSKPEDPLLVESISQSYKEVVEELQQAAAPAPQKQKAGIRGEGEELSPAAPSRRPPRS